MTYDDFKKRYRYDPTGDILGEGAFGKVFRATDTESGSTVAIKVAPVNMANEKHSLKHEFETVGKVDPHLHIALYDECYRFSVEWAGLHDFAILEYYPMGSLDKIIKNPVLTDSDKHDLALGILEGLRHLHNTGAQGVVHRDLKPRNVLIQKWRGKYVAKITDFGLSKFSDSVSNSVISQSFKGGTLNYASPEQIRGEQIRRNTDLWSFGVILHELLTGEVPYKIDDSSESTLRQVYEKMNLQSLPESFKTIKEPYASVIQKCLTVNPNLRYRSAEEVLQDMRKAPAAPITASSPPPVVEPKKELKDQTEIFDESPFASLSNSVFGSGSQSNSSANSGQSAPPTNLEGSGYVKSDPKPKDTKKEKPKKDLTMMIVGAVAILGIITFAVIYFGGGSKKAEANSLDSTISNNFKTSVVVDTTALGQQADSLFNLPNYPEYARVVLKINEAYPANNGGHSKKTALQKLKKGAAGWEQYSLSEPDTRSFLEAFSNAILILDPYDAKGIELQQKLNK
jgi:serine/threonine protein kinase